MISVQPIFEHTYSHLNSIWRGMFVRQGSTVEQSLPLGSRDQLLPLAPFLSAFIHFWSFCCRCRSSRARASSSSCRPAERWPGEAGGWWWCRSCCHTRSRLQMCRGPNSGPTAVRKTYGIWNEWTWEKTATKGNCVVVSYLVYKLHSTITIYRDKSNVRDWSNTADIGRGCRVIQSTIVVRIFWDA